MADEPTCAILQTRAAATTVFVGLRFATRRSLIPGSELVVLEGRGHTPMMSCPEEIATIIESWVQKKMGLATAPQT